VNVPDDLRRTILGWAGAEGAAWLDALPAVVDDLAARWSLRLGEPYVPSGYTALVLRVTCADGTPAVLKVSLWNAPEAAALRHFGGGAAIALLAEDAERGALLLERCEPGTALSHEPDDVAMEVAAGLLGELWSPPAPDHPFATMADSVARWTARLERSQGIVDEDVRLEALDVLPWLAEEPLPPVVLHSDLHPANVLRATRRPWLAIDPKGVVGDPTFDLASLVREDATHENLPRRLSIVCDVLPVDRARVRAWTLAVCAESVAWSVDVGDVVAEEKFRRAARVVHDVH